MALPVWVSHDSRRQHAPIGIAFDFGVGHDLLGTSVTVPRMPELVARWSWCGDDRLSAGAGCL